MISRRILALLVVLAGSLRAQGTAPFSTGIVVGSDWLQANALPLNRDAMQSVAAGLSLRRSTWSIDAEWLRMARSLSTVQGGSLSVGRLLGWKRLLFIPAVGAFGGQGQESRDSTGYNWTATGGTPTGHVPRYSYSSAAAFGGSVGLTIEMPIYRVIGIRAVAQQWYFSGAPLDGDRSRTLLGAGGSIRVGR